MNTEVKNTAYYVVRALKNQLESVERKIKSYKDLEDAMLVFEDYEKAKIYGAKIEAFNDVKISLVSAIDIWEA